MQVGLTVSQSAARIYIQHERPTWATDKGGQTMIRNFIRLFLIGGAGLICSNSGFAQCTDAWVSEGINAVMGRPAIGSGNTGECNIYQYGRGSWSSKQDLFNKIAISSSIRM